MSEPEIVIELGLPDDLRAQAVVIFEDAFGEKTRMAVGDREKRMAFMGRSYRADHVIVARRGDQLLGMAGLSSKGPPYEGGLMGTSWDPRPYRDLLGWVGACWAVWGMRLGDHKPKRDEIYLDGIAVSAEARGQGIGTRLLAEITAVARAQGKRFVRLDVVDTNPRAQALYERVGYKVTRTQSFHWKRRWVGFGAMISMEQRVEPTTAHDSPPSQPGDVAGDALGSS